MHFTINTKHRMFKFSLDYLKKRKNEAIYGYTNRCIDGKFVIFLDYDKIKHQWLLKELNFLQIAYHLSDFYIFKSSEDCYHAVCFDKVPLGYLLEIMRNSSVDPDYVTVPFKAGYRIWTLRAVDKANDLRAGKEKEGKIEYINRLISAGLMFKQSSAHAKLIENLFDIKVPLDHPDEEEKVVLSRYYI